MSARIHTVFDPRSQTQGYHRAWHYVGCAECGREWRRTSVRELAEKWTESHNRRYHQEDTTSD